MHIPVVAGSGERVLQLGVLDVAHQLGHSLPELLAVGCRRQGVLQLLLLL